MRKVLYISIPILYLIMAMPTPAVARSNMVDNSASLKSQTIDSKYDFRVETLENYLEQYNSPLAQYATELVKYADVYGLDWRLVASIAGVESTFGKRIPKGSFNAYGWANGNYYFKSWDDSIEIVSRALRQKYIEKGALSIKQISKRYAPPSSSWGKKVKYFMNKIDPIPVRFSLEV